VVAAALDARPGKPLVVIDIAMPRDVEPAVRSLPGVCLFDLDDVEQVAAANRRQRQAEVAAVEAIIASELGRFQMWLGGLYAVPTISAIRQRAEVARRTELERTLARMTNLAESDRQRIEAMSEALVKRILHDPVTRLKAGSTARRYLGAARYLFGVDEAAARS
jgi:glutamyl-tRNA reductase